MTSEERRERLNRTGSTDTFLESVRAESLRSFDRVGREERTAGRRTGYSAPAASADRYSRRNGGSTGRSGRRRRRRRRNSGGTVLLVSLLCLLVLTAAVFLVRKIKSPSDPAQTAESEAAVTESVALAAAASETETEPPTAAAEAKAEALLEQAALLRAQYDYDGAKELLTADPELAALETVSAFLTELETEKSTLVRQDISQVTHIFFHSLIVDPANALDTSRWGSQADGYNSLMTTIPEFERILEKMYERGYVLVSLHDLSHMETQADGTERMVEGDIMLPAGKKAFVMSEDDVCYYEYMKGAGFADRMVIGEDGRPTLHYTDRNGNESVGDYDIVPILDHFIDEHPDFSYHGHKACLVFTGYNGVLGYRTDESYLPENYAAHKVEGGHDVEAERKEALKVLKALYEDGYDLGSHSWGHRDMGEMSLDSLKTDMDKWEKNVNSLIREACGEGADILIYPKGADIGDWRGYTSSDQKKSGCREKFSYLYGQGFRYFCNVDSSQYWVQKGDNYLRTGRRALDGYNFYIDIRDSKGRFKDLWEDTSEIFDSRRPTPVKSY